MLQTLHCGQSTKADQLIAALKLGALFLLMGKKHYISIPKMKLDGGLVSLASLNIY